MPGLGDMLIGREVSDAALSAALATAFGISADRVALVRSFEASIPECDLLVLVTERDAPFFRQVSPYAPESAVFDTITAAKSVAQQLCCDVMISDESIDPYTMLLVSERGVVSTVSLDTDALDDHGTYRVVSAAASAVRDD